MSLAGQSGAIKLPQQPKSKAEQDVTSARREEKGSVSGQQLADMTNPSVDAYVSSLTGQDNKMEQRTWKQPTITNLEERYAKACEDQYDNAHNMLLEGLFGARKALTGALLRVNGGDPTRINDIRQKAVEQAKAKVDAGFERLASAFAEFDIYAS